MARPIKEVEVKREELEGYLANLGGALCLLDLVSTRVGSAVEIVGHAPLLTPAIEDIHRAKVLIRDAQVMIKVSCPSVFGED